MTTDLDLDQAITSAIGDIVAAAPDTDHDLPLAVGPRAPRRTPRLVRAAAAVAIVVGGVAAIAVATRPGSTEPAGSASAPADDENAYRVPSTSVEQVLDLFPMISDEWAGAAALSASWVYALPNDSRPPVVDALVARVDGSSFRDAVRITVGPMDTSDWGTPTSVTVAGVEVDVYASGPDDARATAVVVLPGEPQVTVSGGDPISYLEAVSGDPVSDLQTDDNGDVRFAISQPPDGYAVVVEPTLRPFGPTSAQTAVERPDTANGVAATTSIENPLLSYAMYGEVAQIDVNGIEGWLLELDSMSNLYWQVDDVWVSVEGMSTVEAALEFARSVELVDEGTWSERFGVTRPVAPSEHVD